MSLLHATILTLFPEMFPGPLQYSLAGQALKNNIWSFDTINIRDFGLTKHKNVDDEAYGGGSGLNGGSGGGSAHNAGSIGLGNIPSTSPSQGNNGGDYNGTNNAGAGGGGAGGVGGPCGVSGGAAAHVQQHGPGKPEVGAAAGA